MGNNTSEISEVLVAGTAVAQNHTEDVFIFVPNGTGEKISVKVSVEICGEEAAEDLQCDISIDLEEIITKAMVGRFGFFKRSRLSRYLGNIRLT